MHRTLLTIFVSAHLDSHYPESTSEHMYGWLRSTFITLIRSTFFFHTYLALISAHPTPTLLQRCQRYSVSLNLFTSIPPSADEHELKTQQISTRLYLFVLTLAFVILLVYTSTVRVIKTVNVKTPTLDQYSQMYSEHQQALVCPCKQISINYETFLQINFSLHQVCSSSFVSAYWQKYIIHSHVNGTLYVDDFRWTGPREFYALNALCKLVSKSISDSLTRFYSNQYVRASVESRELFQTQAQSLIRQFISSITHDFLLSRRLVRDTIQGNSLFSALGTNYGATVKSISPVPFMHSNVISGCKCSSTYTCIQPSSIRSDVANPMAFFVPGMYFGCFVTEALLQSNLECFYNDACFNRLTSRLQSSLPLNVTTLNTSSHSHFSTNATIKALLDELMVDDWYTNITYANYYAKCQPIKCTYTFEARNNMIYIMTTLISLIGGLMTVLKLICPRLVRLAQYTKRRKTQGVQGILIVPAKNSSGGQHGTA